MLYSNLVYSLLINQFWAITPALPIGTPGTRPDVGFPETIPDVTFIARELVATDGFAAPERTRLNGFIQGARRFHNLYGLNPITINSVEDILNHFRTLTTPIGRIRIVSHGNDSFLFLPLFTGGLWDFGLQQDRLQAFQSSDEAGLRFLISGSPPNDPLLVDGVAQIVVGIRTLNSAALTPFGLQASGMPTGDLLKFFEIINDQYQTRHGTIAINRDPPPHVLLSAAQQTTMTTSLTLIENAIRTRLIGTTISGTVVTAASLDALKTAIMGATPIDLEFMGPPFNLSPTVITDITTAMNAIPQVEADIRNAIGSGQPLFRDFLSAFVAGLRLFQPTTLRLGGTDHDVTSIQANAELEAFVFTCVDLHFLKNGPVFINGVAPTAAQKTTIRDAIIAISNMIRTRVTTATPAITTAQLNALRTAIENLPLRQSVITGGFMTLDERIFTELTAANRALQDNFRTKLNNLRGLMKAGDASRIDIRGCLVGATPSFLTVLRNFFGTATNKPTVNAPEFFQSFPFSVTTRSSTHSTNTNIQTEIDNLVSTGLSAVNITDADVSTAITDWQTMTDFDPHFDFITALFAAAASKRDFATLGWRVWRVLPAATGIPMLRMQANRIDDIDTLNLGNLIERFRIIFEVPAASAPNATVRGRLNTLQPHLATFKTKSDAVAAGPDPAALPGLAADLTTLAGSITGIAGFPAPANPLPPASNSLADIQISVTNIAAHLDTILNNELNTFFTAMQGKIAHANAKIRYWYNIGLPLLIQSSGRPTSFAVTTFVGATNATAATTLWAHALRSWMRVQWKGTAAQATAMNATISALAIGTDAQRGNVSQVAMLSEQDPIDVPTTDAGVCPMQAYNDHLVTRP
ncbi:hypothetical protein [Nitrosomonas sp. Nm166]|uniref:hypothetical protein n=1 Tax=Nitrosomonas sp. Nm166 TaxID=1881054 RepID=UPI0008EB2347|nr:hypothetical protein [Nitrosomonas sp. Nm166]SFF10771.1 hypothetical protein SAMN05428977_10512 [Nitrosomonas sp. Nm166]